MAYLTPLFLDWIASIGEEDASAVTRGPRGHCFPLKGPAYAYGAGPMISALAVMASRLGLHGWGFTIGWSRLWLQSSILTIQASRFGGHLSGLTIAAVTILAS